MPLLFFHTPLGWPLDRLSSRLCPLYHCRSAGRPLRGGRLSPALAHLPRHSASLNHSPGGPPGEEWGRLLPGPVRRAPPSLTIGFLLQPHAITASGPLPSPICFIPFPSLLQPHDCGSLGVAQRREGPSRHCDGGGGPRPRPGSAPDPRTAAHGISIQHSVPDTSPNVPAIISYHSQEVFGPLHLFCSQSFADRAVANRQWRAAPSPWWVAAPSNSAASLLLPLGSPTSRY